MYEVASGVQVYYEKKKTVNNIVFFPDGHTEYYSTGEMLLTILSEEPMYLVTTKVNNMIKCMPFFYDNVSVENITEGFKWLCSAICDDNFSIAIEMFRGYFSMFIFENVKYADRYECVGDFFLKCYDDYFDGFSTFFVCVDALARVNSGTDNEHHKVIANVIQSEADFWMDYYTSKCSVRTKNISVTVDAVRITNCFEMLIFEYCRMKKENKVIKICSNCSRFFVPRKADSTYCQAPSPQNSKKTCRKVGASYRQTWKRQNDPIEKQYHNEYSRLHNQIIRSKQNNASPDTIDYFKAELAKLKREEKE